jgi:hypothetical protein
MIKSKRRTDVLGTNREEVRAFKILIGSPKLELGVIEWCGMEWRELA